MAMLYDDKKDIKPLKKEDDAQVKRYVRDTEGNSSKKSNVSQKNKVSNNAISKTTKSSSAQSVTTKKDPEISTPKKEEPYKTKESSTPNERNVIHNESKQEIRKKQVVSPLKTKKEDDFDDEETTFMSSEPLDQKYPFLENAATGERYYVYSVPFTIGKKTTCNLSINSKIVSREHAQIVSDGQKYFVIDMESKNGTYINGYRIIPMNEIEIKNGQTIIFANEKYIFKKEE